jgi:hypothetical protein
VDSFKAALVMGESFMRDTKVTPLYLTAPLWRARGWRLLALKPRRCGVSAQLALWRLHFDRCDIKVVQRHGFDDMEFEPPM